MQTATSIDRATLPAAAARCFAFALPLDHPHVTQAHIVPIDELTARATVRDGGVSASVDFHIDTRGAITRVTTERYRVEKGRRC
jgi:hypothetical protein